MEGRAQSNTPDKPPSKVAKLLGSAWYLEKLSGTWMAP
jgi:hypothetical protein